MKRRPSHSQTGFSLIEVIMAIGLLAFLMTGVALFSQSAIRGVRRTFDAQEKQSVGDSYEKMVMRSIFAVSPLKFDPKQTAKIDPGSDTGFSFVGPRWTVTQQDGTVRTYSNPVKFTIGSLELLNDSHQIEIYKFVRSAATQAITKTTQAVLISRCVQVATWNPQAGLTIEQVLPLRRPYLYVSSTGVKAGYRCCTDTGTDCTDLNDPRWWPTTFYYTGGARVEQWPESASRRTTPGLGFMLAMDRAEPINYHLRLIKMSNSCLTSAVAQPGTCANTVEMASDITNFARDINIQVKETVKPVTSSLNGSSYINVGNAITEGP